MMTGALGVIMWLMMGLMIAAMAGGAITWARRRPRRQASRPPEPPAPGETVRRRRPRRP
jgi:hypothetical protein